MKTFSALRKSVIAASLALGLCGMAPTSALAVLNLPTPDCGISGTNNCLIFDDFAVFSLGVLQDQQSTYNLYDGYSFLAKPNEANLNVLTFNQGTTLQGSGTSIDDPFDSLTGSTNTTNGLFVMAEQSLTSGQVTIPLDPAGGPTGDNSITYGILNGDTFLNQNTLSGATVSALCAADMNNDGCIQSWDAAITDLRTALDGSALVALFQLNEIGESGTLDGQDLTAWARVTLSNPDDTTVAPLVFTLSGNNTLIPQQRLAQTADVDDILPTADDLWAYVHSEVCVQDSSGAVFLGECTASPFDSGDRHTVNQALGADEAGFAIYNQTLDMLVRGFDFGGYTASDYTLFSIDIRLGHLSDGGDQVWFGAATPPPELPEPGSLALLGISFVTLAGIRRRQAMRK